MKKRFGFLKTTLLGGVVFLLPLVLLVAVLGKGIQIMMMVAEPLGKLIPLDTVGGIALVNLIALVVVLITCFFAGFIARSVVGQKVFQSIDSKLLAFPGYALFKARLTGNIGSDLDKRTLSPVLVELGPKSQIGFVVERMTEGRVAVFLPGAPDPWSGSIIFVHEDRTKPLNTDMRQMMQIFETLGRGSSEIF